MPMPLRSRSRAKSSGESRVVSLSQAAPRKRSSASPASLFAPRPRTRPYFGQEAVAESGAWEDDFYDDEDDEEEWEAAAQEAGPEESDAEDSLELIMAEAWPSAVPNRLGGEAAESTPSSTLHPDDYRLSSLGLPLSLPYEVETLAEMDEKLELIVCRLLECVKARDFAGAFARWDSHLSVWMSMGYQMKREIKAKLVFLYYEILFLPGLPASIKEDASNQYILLISDRALSIADFRIPWRVLYEALYTELFPSPESLLRHSVNLAPMYLNVAEASQRFFHPGDVDEMLDAILPRTEHNMDSILATQTFLVHFLPISHCQKWLPVMFRMWYGLNSGLWDDQASDLMGQLAILHVDPRKSDPSIIDRIPRGTHNTPEEEENNPNLKRLARLHRGRLLDVQGQIQEDDQGLSYWPRQELLPQEEDRSDPSWKGIRKDIGIFTEQEFEFLMSKCLRSLNVPVGGSLASLNAMSVTQADQRVSRKILDAKKPIDRVQSLAETIVFCMSEDAPQAAVSSVETPGTATPVHPGPSAPVQPALARLQNGAAMSRTGSTDSLAAAGKKSEENKRYLGGSKALDHLSRLLTSCETFFHPSNSGAWSPFLTAFLSQLAGNFVERWKAEEEPMCKTPVAWRLTPSIKREFVLCLRPLALTSMFNKSHDSVGPAVSTLKKLAILEPDLVMPALIERTVSSLEGLEETQRTPAVTYAAISLAQTLAARNLWRMGGVFIGDIFQLLLPGIDLNDPVKTSLSCMAISNMVDFIKLGDISSKDGAADRELGTRAQRTIESARAEDDPDDPVQGAMEDLTPAEVNERLRFSTMGWATWVEEFVGRVLLLFSNLPEEGGKSGRAGGKTEQMTLNTLLSTCGGVFGALDDNLFDKTLNQVVEYATTTVRANAVDAVGDLARSLTTRDARKTWAKLFPIAKQRIMNELKSGASSTRTTTTSIPLASDAALHWWQNILTGMIVSGRANLSDPAYRADFVELLKFMIEHTNSERGWHLTGKIIDKSMSCLTAYYFREMGMLEPSLTDRQDVEDNNTLWWGKMYRATEIKPLWRIPSEDDISMAFDIIGLADEAVKKLDGLVAQRGMGDKVWTNEFCRALNVIDKTLRGSYNLILEVESLKAGGKEAPSYMPEEMLSGVPTYKSSVLLQNPDDPRYQHVAGFRTRVGEVLHRAANAFRDAGESDSSVEAVKLLVTTMGTWLTAYGIRTKQYSAAQTAYAGLLANKRVYESQRKQHRSVFMAAASVHHQNRLAILGLWRVRSGLDDKLITNMLDFCLSPFVRVRRSAQALLDSIAKLYRGTWVLCMPTLFGALKAGTDPDRMKGALYVLRYNVVGISRISRDWRQMVELVDCLLSAHHETKASIQAQISKATEELIAAIRDPSYSGVFYRTDNLDKAAEAVASVLKQQPDARLIDKARQISLEFCSDVDVEHDRFITRVLEIASDENLNWRYFNWAARLLSRVARRDGPADVRLTRFFSWNILNALPRHRDQALHGLVKIMVETLIRSLCQEDEARLFLMEPIDPYEKEIELTDTSPEWTEKYLASFRNDMPGDSSEEAFLQDDLESGWLIWGKKLRGSRFRGWNEPGHKIEAASQPALDVIAETLNAENFWRRLADHWAQEDQRNYPSANHIDFVALLCDFFGRKVLDALIPIIEGFMADIQTLDEATRHKTRAMWELISGLLRGHEEWNGEDRAYFWSWFEPKLPELFNKIRHDTVKCWDVSIEFILHQRDPRRFKPLVDFCINTALGADFQGGSAFNLARRVQLARSVLRCLQWRFVAWSQDFIDLYFQSLTCPYAEVRGLMASVINAIDQIRWYPSYPDTATFVNDVLEDKEMTKDIMHIRSGRFEPQLKSIMAQLPGWKMERPHGPKAQLSDHDCAASMILMWLSVELSDVHAAANFPYIIPILPEVFELRDLNDNPDLQRNSGRLLAMITSITPSLDLIEPLITVLVNILQESGSWRTKMHCMPVLSLVYFRNLALISETTKAKCLDVVSHCLRDPNQEVREVASATLSGFLRCSQRSMAVVLKNRFAKEIRETVLPKRNVAPGQINPDYQAALVKMHGAVLGATALVEAFPYTVPKFIPGLIADVLAPRVSDPAPISTTIRSCVASFKRTHEKYADKFSEDELSAMNYAQAGNSYYA